MIWFRSVLFLVLALLWTVLTMLLYLPLLLLPRRAIQKAAAFWSQGVMVLARVCCGLRWRAVGREHLSEGAAVIACKHQSAWETLAFHVLLDDPVFVLKRELLWVPLIGWYLRKAGCIAIDRAAGFRAIKLMLPAVDRALARGSQVIVFPEGTRIPVGQRRPYHPGIAAIYARARAPVLPAALNSGLFWGRRRLLKRPGVITLQLLAPMRPGMERKAFMRELETRIEETTAYLCEHTAPAGASTPSEVAGCSTQPEADTR